MATYRLKSCLACGAERRWSQEECPQCGDAEFTDVIESAESLVANAIGDSVVEETLCNAEVPLVDLSEDNRLSGVLPGRLKETANKKTVSILNNPIMDYLDPSEQPQFLLKADSDITRRQDNEVSNLAPGDEFSGARICITDQRTLFLIGQSHGDVVRSIDHADLIRLDADTGIRHGSISIGSETVTYEVPKCAPKNEIDAVVAYLSAQADITHSLGNGQDDNIGTSTQQRVEHVLREASFKQAVLSGATGAKVGARMGPKGAAVGFTIGAGFGIWASVSGQDPTTAEAPDPEEVAENVSTWQEQGAQTDDEKVEWMAAATGAAVSIAAQNSDNQTIRALEEIDPASAVGALEAGSHVIGESATALGFESTELDTLPEITHLRQPAAQTASLTSELLEEGIFEELITTYESLNQ